jgi:hypothetical protein
MEEKDLRIGDNYLLKVNSIKRTWKWEDQAELIEIKEDILIFLGRTGIKRTIYKINKEEFLKGGKVKPKNCWWLDKWKLEY